MGRICFRVLLFFVPVTVVFIGIFFCLRGCQRASVPKENFEGFKISYEALAEIIEISELRQTDFGEAVGVYMLENNFFEEKEDCSEEEIRKFFSEYDNIKSGLNEKELSAFSGLINKIFEDLKTFPLRKR
ncbi:MAG: hypothetical protein LUG24_02870 [Clostridiales bacterium]|nr:hypothetical protein [Clostridiales bacterium]